MRLAHCIYVIDSENPRLIIGLQDSFGKQFFAFKSRLQPGRIVDIHVQNRQSRTISGDGRDPAPMRIIGPAHHSTVQALLNRSGRAADGRLITGRHWHEVHVD